MRLNHTFMNLANLNEEQTEHTHTNNMLLNIISKQMKIPKLFMGKEESIAKL